MLVSIKELSTNEILKLIKRAIAFKNGLKMQIDQSLAMIFLEPSTRTLLSFQKAAKNLAMPIFNLDVAKSSFQKGETLEDTLMNLQAMGINNFIIRARKEHYWNDFVNQFNIINAGDGTENHPSQALLDAMTIYESLGTLSNLKVAIIGDIKHSRVYHSNKVLLEKFNTKIDVLGPAIFGANGDQIDAYLNQYDVVIFLRIQHERHKENFDIENYNNVYGLNKNNVKKLKNNAIFMHPGPVNRNVEISEDLLYDHPQNKILMQVKNGVFMRMAILEKVCKNT